MRTLAALLLALALAAPALGAVPARLVVDGETLDVPLLLPEGRLHAPLRPLAAAMGAAVHWDGRAAWVTWAGGTRQVEPGPAAPILKGRLYVPVRWLGEALGAGVEWRPEEHTAYVHLPRDGNARRLLALAQLRGHGDLRVHVAAQARKGDSVVLQREFFLDGLDWLPAAIGPGIIATYAAPPGTVRLRADAAYIGGPDDLQELLQAFSAIPFTLALDPATGVVHGLTGSAGVSVEDLRLSVRFSAP